MHNNCPVPVTASGQVLFWVETQKCGSSACGSVRPLRKMVRFASKKTKECSSAVPLFQFDIFDLERPKIKVKHPKMPKSFVFQRQLRHILFDLLLHRVKKTRDHVVDDKLN